MEHGPHSWGRTPCGVSSLQNECGLGSSNTLYFETWLSSSMRTFSFFFLIYLFLAALGLRCCAQAFSSCDKRGLLFVAVRGLLIAVASLVVEHGL